MTVIDDLAPHLDEHHSAVIAMLPPELLDLTDIPACRTMIEGFLAQMPTPDLPTNVTISEVMVPGHDGDPDVRLKLYVPDGLAAGSPALLWIHGGGMILLSADGDDALCAQRAADHNMLVASVDYRLSPESPAPALVNDCYAGLSWLAANAATNNVDPARIMIGGASAGGGLAAGTALYARDHGGPSLAGQLLVFPMLDHRNETASSHAITDARVWNRQTNILAWEAYLGGDAPTIYSSPSLATDLSGLPPAYINVGQFDLFLDEDVAYARALLGSGVSAELHVYPGAFHGSQSFLADHPLSQRWQADEEAFIKAILGT